MEEIWKRLKAWLKTNAPHALRELQAGATETQIRELEEFFNVQFSEGFKASYRICNGQIDNSDFLLIDAEELLSLEGIKREWITIQKLTNSEQFHSYSQQDFKSFSAPEVRSLWWLSEWIPLTSSRAFAFPSPIERGNYCLDFNPSKEGIKGQIISTELDGPERKLVAPNFKSWLQQYVEDLESDKLEFHEGTNAIWYYDQY